MMHLYRKTFKPFKRQNGLYIVEFAVCSGVFLVALFMVLEFARLLFVFNVLDEMTRRGARLAAVCPVASQASFIDTSILNGNILNIDSTELVIDYLDESGNSVDDPVGDFDQIRYVRARIQGYQHQSFFPMSITFDAPDFQTTLPSESLGLKPVDSGDTIC